LKYWMEMHQIQQ